MRSVTALLGASAVALVALAGCATPYQARGFSGGFDERWQTERSVVVTFTGNGFTPREQAERYATIRAAELALERGYPYLRVATSSTEVAVTRSGSILTGGVRTSRKPGVELQAVLLSEPEARELERQGVPVIQARFYIEEHAPDAVRRRVLGS